MTMASSAHGEISQPASPSQRRVWFLTHLDESGDAFHETAIVRVSGCLTPDGLRAGLAELARRHEILRTRLGRLPWGSMEQIVETKVALPCACVDLRLSEPEGREREVARLAADDRQQRFDLEKAGLLRTTLVQLGEGDSTLVMTAHRLIADAPSLDLLIRDLLTICDGRAKDLPPPGVTFAALARRMAEKAQAGGYEPHLAYWRGRLGGAQPMLDFPLSRARGLTPHHRHAQVDIAVDEGLRRRMDALAQEFGVDAARVLLAAFAVLLFRYTGQRDIRIGLPGRCCWGAETEGVVGPLTNIQILRTTMDSSASFAHLLAEQTAGLAEAEAYGDLPFEQLIEDLHTDRSLAVSPLFQVMFHHGADWSTLPGIGLQGEIVARQHAASAGELCLEAGTGGLALHYARDLLRRPVVARMSTHLVALLRGLTAAPHQPIRAIPLLNAAELDVLSAPWPTREYETAPVHRLIEAHARRRPQAPAIVFGDGTVCFAELEERATRLARHLAGLGIGPEIRVGVAVERSAEMIVVLLAVLKANGAFVPLDPDHPAERIAYILSDAGVTLLLTQDHLCGRLPVLPNVPVIAVDRLDLADEAHIPLPTDTHPDQLAYIIYTSGSTGRPKGVEVCHGPLSMHCQATADLYDIDENTRELHFLSISFDGAHERWLVPLICGGAIVLRGQSLWSAAETLAAMGRHDVTNAGFPTSYFLQLAEWADQRGNPPPVRLYSFGGEAMPRATFDLARRALRPTWLINGYGPTEAVISPMVWKASAAEGFPGAYAPIGRAVGARRAYVLDADLNPVPIGVTGELYLGGQGLARGYHGKPAATAERFLPDPFSGDGGRLYRTGDLARWLDDGMVEFLGRSDNQVKLRGFRIELGEIEAQLRETALVSDATVVLDPTAPRLLAYVVPVKGETIDPVALRAELACSLPDYMVPAAILVLDRFPVTPNGKTDRNALPVPAPQTAEDLVPPGNDMELRIAGIWQDILKIPAIGVTWNFFEIGGDSLSALKVVSRLRDAYPEKRVTVVDLFNNPEIRRLAVSLKDETVGTTQVVHMRRGGSRPMLYCFPGLLVSTREYGGLVRYLGDDQPATGFICHTLSEGGAETTVEDLAATYADFIRNNTPGGECILLGWSWGGILAYEAARLLAGSVAVKFVGMLDVCALDAEFAAGAAVSLSPADRQRLQSDIDQWLNHTAMRADWEELFSRMDARVYTQFLCYVRKSKESLPVDGPEIGSREHIFWTLMQNALVFRNYTMQPSDNRIHAWIAEDSLVRGMNVIDWRKFSPHTERVEVIRGTTHLEIIRSEAFHRSFAHSVETAV